RHPGAAACLDLERMVQPGQYAGHRVPLLSRASAADAAREEEDPRRRRRHLVGVHEHPAPRSRARGAARLSAAPPASLAAAVRTIPEALSEVLPAEPVQPAFRPASAAVVRAEPSGRGFRRDLRGLAAAPFQLAHALRGLAGIEEARICRRADGRDRRTATTACPPG